MSDIIPFRKDDDAKRAALRERRRRDSEALVATISVASCSFRIFAPRDLGTPAVEIRHPFSLPGPLYITPRQAFELGRALMDAAQKWTK